MTPADVVPSYQVMQSSFDDLAVRRGRTPYPATEAGTARGRARIAHLQGTDPDSAFVAEADGEIVGCSLSLVRGGMWFLSLLVVAPGHQGAGHGRALLEASLATATDRAWILSTDDPAALRRYQRAGFALHPSFAARGTVDRAVLPAVSGIRDGDETDRETLDQVVKHLRGAPMGPDADYLFAHGVRLLVAPGRGFVACRDEGPMWLGASDVPTARALLWSALAEAPGAVEVVWLGPDQQWAIDVCLEARLTLGPGGTLCLRGQPAMSPYLPSGAFG